MNRESAKIRAETGYIRIRTLARTVLQVTGVALVLLGAYNYWLAGVQPGFAPYYPLWDLLLDGTLAHRAFSHIAAMGVGACMAWFL